MKILFWGATDEVTGSMTFMSEQNQAIMIDCGLCQGGEDCKEKNLRELPFHPNKISDIYLTHAHLDHSGYLPRIVKNGFAGNIHCSPATAKLVKIILTDSANLNDSTPDPLYGQEDVKKTLKLIKTHPWYSKFQLLTTQAYFIPAGHILGASSLFIEANRSIIFSGDLGRSDDLIMPPPEVCPKADMVIMESTYGDRNRIDSPRLQLKKLVEQVSSHKMIGIIASFALARGQMIITLLEEIFQESPHLRIPLFFDGPMMKEINNVYLKYSHLTKMPKELINSLNSIESIEFERQWNWLKKKTGPLIIISSSGMITGGRILRHLENWQTEKNAILFLAGFQAPGTIGRSLLDGHRRFSTPEGKDVTWSGDILGSDAFSSHAEQSELIQWLKPINPENVFLLHGEEHAKESLKIALHQYKVIIPKTGDEIEC